MVDGEALRERALQLLRGGAEGVAAWNLARTDKRSSDPRESFFLMDLQGAALSGQNLSGVDLVLVDLRGADLRGADLSHAKLVGANLAGADLSGAKLGHANLHEARLLNARMTAATMTYAVLREAQMVGADLRGASLPRAYLHSANLRESDLRSCDLTEVDFKNTSLAGALLADATCGWTNWSNVDLRDVLGLDSLQHRGPSTVGIDTLLRSGGRLPEGFLRGCGVPEHVIVLQKSLAESTAAIEFHSCFISYSSRDEEFARRLHGRLQQEGLRVWFAPEDMKAGRKLHDQIDEAIRVHDKLLLVVSDASMQSEWVATEISKARKRERKEGRQVLFPLRLVEYEKIQDWECFDADAGKDAAREVREYFLPDFSGWKQHDAFEAAFARLVKDLRASVEPPRR